MFIILYYILLYILYYVIYLNIDVYIFFFYFTLNILICSNFPMIIQLKCFVFEWKFMKWLHSYKYFNLFYFKITSLYRSWYKMINIRHVQVTFDKMKKFTSEMDKTQYDCDYVIISSIFIQKINISIELPYKSSKFNFTHKCLIYHLFTNVYGLLINFLMKYFICIEIVWNSY